METKYYQVDKNQPDIRILAEAADVLKQGGLVAFPTETVYGLGANGLDPRAVTRISPSLVRQSFQPIFEGMTTYFGSNRAAR